MKRFTWGVVFSGVMLLASIQPVWAQRVGPFEYSGSGFASIVLGRILGGTHDESASQGYRCPCFISDYSHHGVYEAGRVQLGPDSRLGYQGMLYTPDRRLSLTGQVVFRGSANGAPNLEWVYGTYEVNSKLTLQAGRKRLPLFAYSEVQDVGFALPWNHLPPQLYGWEIVNYNGASVAYRDTVGGWLTHLNLFGGGETTRDAGYWKVYNGKDSRTDARWKNILGVEAKLSRGGFEGRLVHIESDTQNRKVSAGQTEFSDRKRQRIEGVSLSYDLQNWLLRAERLWIDRTQDYGRDRASLVAIGYRWGRFTPLVSYSSYHQKINDDAAPAESHSTRSAVLRYDLDHRSAIKVQIDVWRDRSQQGVTFPHGNARLLTAGYDLVF